MRRLVFHKKFEKQFSALKPAQKERVKTALASFAKGENLSSLRIHKLVGEFRGQISLSAGGDLRVHIIEDEEDALVIALQVESHSQLYR